MIIYFIFLCKTFSQEIIYSNSTKKIDLYANQLSELEIFQGLLLQDSITFNENFQYSPCKVNSQQLYFISKNEENLLPEYKAEGFRNQYNNGYFNGYLPKLINLVKIPEGAIVLTNGGEFIFFKKMEQTYKMHSLQRYPQVANQTKILLQNISEGLLVFCGNQIYQLIPNFQLENIFQDSELIKLNIEINQNFSVSKSFSFRNYIFLLSQNISLLILQYDQNSLYLINNIENQYIQDAAYTQYNNQYQIIISDYKEGVNFYNFDSGQIIKNIEIQTIEIFGDLIDVQENQLLVAQKLMQFKYLYMVDCFKFDLTNNTIYHINTFELEGSIQNIETHDDYALLIGDSVHKTLYPSISTHFSTNNTLIYDTFIIPGLQMALLETLNSTTTSQQKSLLIGITNRGFFAFQIIYIPPTLICQIDKTFPRLFTLNLQINTTQCQEKKDKINMLQICSQNIVYEFEVFYPLFTTFDIPWIKFVLTFVGILVVSLIVVFFYSYQEYRTQTKKYQKQLIQIKTLNYDINQRRPQKNSMFSTSFDGFNGQQFQNNNINENNSHENNIQVQNEQNQNGIQD